MGYHTTPTADIPKPTVSSTILAPAIAFALGNGVPVEDLEAVAGVSTSEILGTDNRVSEGLPARIILSLFDSQSFAAPTLQIANSTSYLYFGGLEKAAKFAPTGLHALEIFHHYSRLLADRTKTWLDESENFVSFHFSHPADGTNDGVMQEIGMALRWRLMRDVMGPNAMLSEVGFGFSDHARSAHYQDMFGAPPQFNRPNGDAILVFKKADLSEANAAKNRILYEAGRIYLQEFARNREIETACNALQSLSRAASICVENGNYSAGAVAAEAGISLRIAQRIAASRRTSMRALIDEARLRKAKGLILGDLKITFEVVAEETGYSDERAFRRFFKRATGLSPSQYRGLVRS
ncbi:MAG: helix-turn-helix domain-containing protein [Pseudomonadota bacterium]